jgi:hypothetical protein
MSWKVFHCYLSVILTATSAKRFLYITKTPYFQAFFTHFEQIQHHLNVFQKSNKPMIISPRAIPIITSRMVFTTS